MTENTDSKSSTKDHLLLISGSCLILTFLVPFVAVWWWAILGMTVAVGEAVVVTTILLFFFAWVASVAAAGQPE